MLSLLCHYVRGNIEFSPNLWPIGMAKIKIKTLINFFALISKKFFVITSATASA